MAKIEVIQAPKRGESKVAPEKFQGTAALGLFELQEFTALDPDCVIFPLGQEPYAPEMPPAKKILVFDTKTKLFGVAHVQKVGSDENPIYAMSHISRPEASDCTQLSVVLTAMGAQDPGHELNTLYISYRKTIVAFVQEDETFDQGVREQLSLRQEDRSALLEAIGI